MKAKKHSKNGKRNYKRLAAAIAGATIAAASLLPGIPAAQAAAPADNNNAPVAAEQVKGNTVQPGNVIQKIENEAAKIQAEHPGNQAPEHYKMILNIKATAYAPGPHDNDQWGNRTFMGTRIREGIIAVDPHVIPLGSQVYIQFPDGHGTYAVAEDTGGAIKGHRIDIAKNNVREAENFGIQQVKVFVVKTPETPVHV
jgi:3D (Asp-Asp-Asp) domain-containing protein